MCMFMFSQVQYKLLNRISSPKMINKVDYFTFYISKHLLKIKSVFFQSGDNTHALPCLNKQSVENKHACVY